MDDLILFHWHIGLTFILLLTFITLIILYRTLISFSPRNMIRGLLPTSRRPENIDTVRSVPQFLQILFMMCQGLKNFLAIYAFISFLFQLVTMALIIAIELNTVPPFTFPNVEDVVPSEELFTFFVILIIAEVVDLILIFIVFLIFLYDKPPTNRTPPITEGTRWEHQSRDYALIRLNRFENSEKTIILADCRNDLTGRVFKFALCQANEEGARTDCYLYDEEGQTLDRIIPTPITLNELEELFSVGYY